MAIIKRMHPKGKGPFLESFVAWNKRRAQRVIAAYDRKIKESLKDPNKKTISK